MRIVNTEWIFSVCFFNLLYIFNTLITSYSKHTFVCLNINKQEIQIANRTSKYPVDMPLRPQQTSQARYKNHQLI